MSSLQDVIANMNQQSQNNSVAKMMGEIYALSPAERTPEAITAIWKKYSFGYEWEKNVDEISNKVALNNQNNISTRGGVSSQSDLEADIKSNNQNNFVNDPRMSTKAERAKGSTGNNDSTTAH